MHLLSRLSGRRTHVLVAFITFSLASGVLGGVIFYIDSVGPEIMRDFTEDVGIDMQVHVSSTTGGCISGRASVHVTVR